MDVKCITIKNATPVPIYPLSNWERKDVNSDGTVTDIYTLDGYRNVVGVKYVNAAGVVSDRPFKGVNIVVTEYSDGSRTTVKMIK